MSLMIHVGIRREEIPIFSRYVKEELHCSVLDAWERGINRNDWNTWAEFEVTKEHSEDIVHMTIETLTPIVIINWLVNRAGIFIHKLEDEKSVLHGRSIIVTDSRHWNEFYVELNYPD